MLASNTIHRTQSSERNLPSIIHRHLDSVNSEPFRFARIAIRQTSSACCFSEASKDELFNKRPRMPPIYLIIISIKTIKKSNFLPSFTFLVCAIAYFPFAAKGRSLLVLRRDHFANCSTFYGLDIRAFKNPGESCKRSPRGKSSKQLKLTSRGILQSKLQKAKAENVKTFYWKVRIAISGVIGWQLHFLWQPETEKSSVKTVSSSIYYPPPFSIMLRLC